MASCEHEGEATCRLALGAVPRVARSNHGGEATCGLATSRPGELPVEVYPEISPGRSVRRSGSQRTSERATEHGNDAVETLQHVLEAGGTLRTSKQQAGRILKQKIPFSDLAKEKPSESSVRSVEAKAAW